MYSISVLGNEITLENLKQSLFSLGKNKKKEILINKTELNRKKKRKGKINKKKGKKETYNSHFVLLFVNL